MTSSSSRPRSFVSADSFKRIHDLPMRVVYGGFFRSYSNLPINTTQRCRFGTIKQIAAAYSAITTESALRHLIWQAEAYARNPKACLKSNGFLPVIHRPGGGRKILLNWEAFDRWLSAGPHSMGEPS